MYTQTHTRTLHRVVTVWTDSKLRTFRDAQTHADNALPGSMLHLTNTCKHKMQLHTHAVKTVHSQHLEDMLVTGRHYVFILTSSITGATCLSLGKKGREAGGKGEEEERICWLVKYRVKEETEDGGGRKTRLNNNKLLPRKWPARSVTAIQHPQTYVQFLCRL